MFRLAGTTTAKPSVNAIAADHSEPVFDMMISTASPGLSTLGPS
jgi:hypothetical protein